LHLDLGTMPSGAKVSLEVPYFLGIGGLGLTGSVPGADDKFVFP